MAAPMPWELAGRAPAGVEWVVSWELKDTVELRPFWAQALTIEQAGSREVKHLNIMLALTGLTLDELCEFFDGSGSLCSLSQGATFQLKLGLRPEAGLFERLKQQWKLDDKAEISQTVAEQIVVDCTPTELSITVGPTVPSPETLALTAGFRAARSKLSGPANLVIFSAGDESWRYAALTVDLEEQTSQGFLAWSEDPALNSNGSIDPDLLRQRPEELKTLLVLDLPRVHSVLEHFQNQLPRLLNSFRTMLGGVRDEGQFLQVIDGPGLVGVNTDPLSLFLTGTPDLTIFAVGRYRQLDTLEQFLGDLEYQVRLNTLKKCEENLSHLIFCLSRYEVDFKKPTPADFSPLVPKLLDKVPNCPAAGRPTYAIESSPEGSSIYCKGDHHPQTPPNYPRYDRKLGLVRGEPRERPKLRAFSRVDADGRADYRLLSGQRIQVDIKNRVVKLSDGQSDKLYLSQSETSRDLPELMQANLDQLQGELIYLDYTDLSDGLADLRTLSKRPQDDLIVSLLATSALEGLRQGGTHFGSNLLYLQSDGLAYRGRGIWASQALATPLAATPLIASAVRRRQHLATARQCRDNLVLIAGALKHYGAEHPGLLPDNLQQLVPQYLSELPQCPASGTDSYSKSYFWENRSFGVHQPRKVVFEVFCLGHHHKEAGWSENRPYVSEEGVRPRE